MIIAMVAISVLVLALCIYVGSLQVARYRTPPELRGDWWSEFEREFRAYTLRATEEQATRRSDRPAKRPPAA